MIKEDIFLESLKGLNYKYSSKKNHIKVKLGLGLICSIKKVDDSFKIDGYLTRWNFLTGLFKLNIDMASVYITFWTLVILGLYYKYNIPPFLSEFVLIIVFLWTLSWHVFYLTKFFSFKRMIETKLIS